MNPFTPRHHSATNAWSGPATLKTTEAWDMSVITSMRRPAASRCAGVGAVGWGAVGFGVSEWCSVKT